MREGKNREIRNVLGALGLQVNRLIRVSYGPFQLGELPAGAVMEIKTRALREQIGERLAALAGADFSGPLVEREVPAPQAPHAPRHPEVRAWAGLGRPAAAPRASKGDGRAAGQPKRKSRSDPGPSHAARRAGCAGHLRMTGRENGRAATAGSRTAVRITGRRDR